MAADLTLAQNTLVGLQGEVDRMVEALDTARAALLGLQAGADLDLEGLLAELDVLLAPRKRKKPAPPP